MCVALSQMRFLSQNVPNFDLMYIYEMVKIIKTFNEFCIITIQLKNMILIIFFSFSLKHKIISTQNIYLPSTKPCFNPDKQCLEYVYVYCMRLGINLQIIIGLS